MSLLSGALNSQKLFSIIEMGGGGGGEGGGEAEAGNHGGLHIHLKHLKSTASWIHSFSQL